MTINPFANRLAALQATCRRKEEQAKTWESQLDWFRSFHADESHRHVLETERTIETDGEHLALARKDLDACHLRLLSIDERAALGFNPLHWVSSERAVARQQSAAVRREIGTIENACRKLEGCIKANEKKSEAAREELALYRKFDVLLAEASVRGLYEELAIVEPELARLDACSTQLDVRILEPARSLRKFQSERTQLESDAKRATHFDDQLTRAQTGSERARIHEACEKVFGQSSPRTVMRDREERLRPVRRSIDKLEERIRELVSWSQLDVRRVVIDGCNLCYQGQESQRSFIGFSALDALVPELMRKKIGITMIFDSGIRRLKGARGVDVHKRFQGAEVHVVDSKTTADQLILDAADGDEHAYVISNDRFVDFPDKTVVTAGRVLPHVMLKSVVHVYPLNISVDYLVDGAS